MSKPRSSKTKALRVQKWLDENPQSKPRARKTKKKRMGLETQHSQARRGLWIPSETMIMLRELVNENLYSTGNPNIAERFYLNSTYHTAPSVLLVSAGKTVMEAQYTYNRVVMAILNIVYQNLEAFDVSVYTVISNTDPGTANYPAYSENPLCKAIQLGPVGTTSSTFTYRKTIRMSEIVGTGNVETADSFRATAGADPIDLLWFSHAAYCAGTNVFTAAKGIQYKKVITRETRYYSRILQTS